MKNLKTFIQSIYVKIIFGGLIIFCGIFGGIYVGHAILEKEPIQPLRNISNSTNSNNELDEKYVNFNSGDLFPLETFLDAQGNQGNFESLLKNKPTVLIFVSLTCGPCHDMLKYWKMKIQNKLRKNVQVIVCIRKEEGKIPDEFVGILEGLPVVRFDGSYWKLQYDMAFWPTIITVDKSGFVHHVQLGFESYIDYEIVNEYFIQ